MSQTLLHSNFDIIVRFQTFHDECMQAASYTVTVFQTTIIYPRLQCAIGHLTMCQYARHERRKGLHRKHRLKTQAVCRIL